MLYRWKEERGKTLWTHDSEKIFDLQVAFSQSQLRPCVRKPAKARSLADMRACFSDVLLILLYLRVEHRINIGSILNRFWITFGSVLDRFWINRPNGPKRTRIRSNSDLILVPGSLLQTFSVGTRPKQPFELQHGKNTVHLPPHV